MVVRPATRVTDNSEITPKVKPISNDPESPRKIEAGLKLYFRKPSVDPHSAIAKNAASSLCAIIESTNIVALTIKASPVARPSRPSMRLKILTYATK